MPFNSMISRSDSEALIPESVTREILQNVPKTSLVMQLGRKLPNMNRKQQRLPVLSLMPYAYFVNGDTGLKQTSRVAWDNKYLNAEEIAVIIPIPEAVLDDADYDIWGEVRPLAVEALGAKFDKAVISGEDAPAAWPDDLITSATAAGNSVTMGTGADLYDDVLSPGGLFSKVERDGYRVTGSIAHVSMASEYRGLRDANGQPIFLPSMQDPTRYMLNGTTIEFDEVDILDETEILQISGDFRQLVYAIRQDVTYKVLDQAVLSDGAGNIIYNLAQQDMVALRVVMRVAWQVPNPKNRLQPDEANRYPFAVLKP